MPEYTDQEAMSAFGKNLDTYRKEVRRLTVSEMAKELRISRVTYYRMIKGEPGMLDQWVKVWRRMGVLDDMIKASEPDMFQAVVHEFPEYG